MTPSRQENLAILTQPEEQALIHPELDQAIAEITEDAMQQAKNYLQDAIVPDGGE